MFNNIDIELRKHIFWKRAFQKNNIFTNLTDGTIVSIKYLVKYVYLFFLFLTVIRFNYIEDIQNATVIESLWPVLWLKYISFKTAINTCMVLLFLSFIGASISPQKRWLRITSFLLFFIYTALIHSFGKISHIYHLLLVVLFFFIFLTYKKEKESSNILVVASLQFFILLTYTFTGLWKIIGGFIQLFKGEVSLFSLQAMPNIIENQFAINNQELPYYTHLLLEHSFLGFILLWGAVLLELFSVFIFFKAPLHRVWGALLICMHAGIALILDVNFYVAPFVLGVFFVFSPFYKEGSFVILFKKKTNA